jgi:hypothetical protein
MAKIDDIRAAKVDWPRLRQGFEDIAREYPDSLWNKNAFCFYAYVLNDRVTARRLFAQLKGRYAREIWGSEATFERIESWASSETPSR